MNKYLKENGTALNMSAEDLISASVGEVRNAEDERVENIKRGGR